VIYETIGRDRPNKLVAIDQTAGRDRRNNWPRWTGHLCTRALALREILSIGCKISIVRGTICYLFCLEGGGVVLVWGYDGYEIRDTQDSVLLVAALLNS